MRYPSGIVNHPFPVFRNDSHCINQPFDVRLRESTFYELQKQTEPQRIERKSNLIDSADQSTML